MAKGPRKDSPAYRVEQQLRQAGIDTPQKAYNALRSSMENGSKLTLPTHGQSLADWVAHSVRTSSSADMFVTAREIGAGTNRVPIATRMAEEKAVRNAAKDARGVAPKAAAPAQGVVGSKATAKRAAAVKVDKGSPAYRITDELQKAGLTADDAHKYLTRNMQGPSSARLIAPINGMSVGDYVAANVASGKVSTADMFVTAREHASAAPAPATAAAAAPRTNAAPAAKVAAVKPGLSAAPPKLADSLRSAIGKIVKGGKLGAVLAVGAAAAGVAAALRPGPAEAAGAPKPNVKPAPAWTPGQMASENRATSMEIDRTGIGALDVARGVLHPKAEQHYAAADSALYKGRVARGVQAQPWPEAPAAPGKAYLNDGAKAKAEAVTPAAPVATGSRPAAQQPSSDGETAGYTRVDSRTGMVVQVKSYKTPKK